MVDGIVVAEHATPKRPIAGRPLHVLVSAYACDPIRGSEPGIGWNWVQHLSQYARLSVITRTKNRASIEAWQSGHPLANVHFYYVDLPPSLSFWKQRERGLYLYYSVWQALALRAARQVLAADPFDLAHHITFGSLHMPVFLQRLPVPLIYGPVGGGEMGHAAFRQGGGLRASTYERLRALRMNTVRWDPLIQATLRHASHILVTTPETSAFIPSRFAEKTSVMPAVGVERVDRCDREVRRGRGFRIYTAGRLVHWKGFHLAIQAFARIAPRYPEATFTIVGDGPQRTALEQLAAQTGVGDRVHIKPWLPRDEVLQLTTDSDLLLYPSLHDSGGMVVLEAMVRGKPVICLDKGGPAVMVTSEAGMKVPVTSPARVVDDLAVALENLMTNDPLRCRMGEAARQRALEAYTWERKAEHMLPIYQKVVMT